MSETGSVSASASVATDAGARYAKQLASHLGHKAEVLEEPEGTRIVIAGGVCLLVVTTTSLELHAQAPAREQLDRVTTVIGSHLERFGQRNELRVQVASSLSDAGRGMSRISRERTSAGSRRRRRGRLDQLLSRLQEALRRAAVADARGRAGEDDVAGQQRARPPRAARPGRRAGKIIWRCAPGCSTSPSRLRLDREVVAVGELVGRDEPRAGRPEAGERLAEPELRRLPCSCMTRSERSWPIVRPATASHARSRGMRKPPRPITATTSTSQSTLPSGSTTVGAGPTMQVGNFVKHERLDPAA